MISLCLVCHSSGATFGFIKNILPSLLGVCVCALSSIMKYLYFCLTIYNEQFN